MSIKGHDTSYAERVEIGERWQAGQSDRAIALAPERPLPTIQKWRRHYQQDGQEGLTSLMGRSVRGALGQFPSEIADEILQLRQAHPGWGPNMDDAKEAIELAKLVRTLAKKFLGS